jgi:hypothetical protein
MAKTRQAKRSTRTPARRSASSRKTGPAKGRSTKRSVQAKRKASAGAAKSPAKRRAARKTRKKTTAAQTEARLIVVTSGERPVHEVAGELEKAGFAVEQVLDSINQVTGRAQPRAMRRLKSVRGVTDVSREHPPISIGPPDAPIS